ncbi:acyltransferase domain-containing protein [Streptomyces sp. NPDC059564]|uniref:acyltransferase domain-containing protein n=1 Tax=Streptomyces sp. NPDC059564 TaxID=3346865 RepID=UPI0036A8F9BE
MAITPFARARHRELNIPEAISRSTFADLGRQMAVHRRRHGTGGLLNPGWFTLHLRGEMYQLGRLQYERAPLDPRTADTARAAGVPVGPGDLCLSLHIPGYLGPMTDDACERSIVRTREFFRRFFPHETYPVAICDSWLLDPQLAEYLPSESNILRFQRRFGTAYESTEPDDGHPVEYVFGDPALPPGTLPRRNTVERAIGDHLRAGRHWYGGHGWFAR